MNDANFVEKHRNKWKVVIPLDAVNIRKFINENIKFLRTQKKLSQAEVATQTGLKRSKISAIETLRYTPTYQELKLISGVLNVPFELLYFPKDVHKTIEEVFALLKEYNYKKALDLCDDLILLYKDGVFYEVVLLIKGTILYEQGNYKTAIDLCSKALDQAKNSLDAVVPFALYLIVILCKYNLRNYDEAFMDLNQAAYFAVGSDQLKLQLMSAVISIESGNFDDALEILVAIKPVIEEHNMKQELIQVMHNIGYIYLLKKIPDLAFPYLEYAHQLSIQLHNFEFAAIAAENIVKFLIDTHQLDRAEEMIQRTFMLPISLSHKIKLSILHASFVNDTSNIYILISRMHEYLNVIEYEQMDRKLISLIQERLANLYEKIEDFYHSSQFYRKALINFRVNKKDGGLKLHER